MQQILQENALEHTNYGTAYTWCNLNLCVRIVCVVKSLNRKSKWWFKITVSSNRSKKHIRMTLLIRNTNLAQIIEENITATTFPSDTEFIFLLQLFILFSFLFRFLVTINSYLYSQFTNGKKIKEPIQITTKQNQFFILFLQFFLYNCIQKEATEFLKLNS